MKKILRYFFLIVFFFLSLGGKWGGLFAQLPIASGPGSGLIYFAYYSSTTIYNYDPRQPVSSGNPSINSISLPSGFSGLAASADLNATNPNPTFYTTANPQPYQFYYYNGIGWTNTGYRAGGGTGELPTGSGNGFIYNVGIDSIYKYKGSANSTGIAYINNYYSSGIGGDCSGSFFLLQFVGSSTWLYKYDSNAAALDSFIMIGAPPLTSGAKRGPCVIHNKIYFVRNASNTMWCGTLVGDTVYCSPLATSSLFSSLTFMSTFPSSAFGAAQASADTVIYCSGGAGAQVSATGRGPFTWTVISGPAVISGSGDTVSITSTATSRILLSSSYHTSCGDSTDTVTVLVRSIPVYSISSNSPVCSGDSLQLSASSLQAGLVYNWSGPVFFTDTGMNAVRHSMALADSGYYYVTATLNGCSQTDSAWISVKPTPAIPVATSNSPLCAGDSLQLSVSNWQPTLSYNWNGPGFASAIYDPKIYNIQLADSGNYIVRVSQNNCSTADTIHISVKTLPALPVATINSPVCAGDSLQLGVGNLQSGVSYQWNGPNGFSSSIYDPAISNVPIIDSGKYRVFATLNGCVSKTDTIDVTIHMVTVPSVNITSAPATIIAGHTDTFTAHVNGCDSPTYEWYINGSLTSSTGSSYITSLAGGSGINVRVHCLICASPDTAVSNVITAPLGVSSVQHGKGDLNVWPNPVTGNLYLSLPEGEGTMRVHDEVGRLMYDRPIFKGITTIDMSVYGSGVYFLQMIYENGTKVVRKIVKE